MKEREVSRPAQVWSSGLTVRCFRNGRPPDGWCPAHVARLVSMAMPVYAATCGPGRMSGRDRTPATSMDAGGPCGSHRGHGNPCDAAEPGPGPLLPQATATSRNGSRVGVRRAWPPLPTVRNRSGSAADTAGHVHCGRPECRPGSRHRGGTAVSGVHTAGAVATGTVAGSVAAGRMQPAPVDVSEPGGQLAADIGHRRPGERAGLLQAEIVELQPGHLAVAPAADDRLAT
jgi:hypothetical protein